MSKDKTDLDDIEDSDIDRQLMALVARMPRSVTPARDLWPAIEEAILQADRDPVSRPQRSVQRSVMGWNTVWAQAAAVLLLVGGSSGITWYATKSDGLSMPPQVVSIDKIFEPVSGEFGANYSLGPEYLDARDQLEGSLLSKIDSLPRETRDDVVKNLNTIRLAIRDINQALAEEPDNQLLQKLLLSTYHEEMNLMKKVDGLANSVMRRDDI